MGRTFGRGERTPIADDESNNAPLLTSSRRTSAGNARADECAQVIASATVNPTLIT